MGYSEDGSPLASRIFILEGRISSKRIKEYKESIFPLAIKKYKNKLDEEWETSIDKYLQIPASDTQGYFLASYSYTDIYIETSFDVVYKYSDVKTGVKTKAVILAIIHEWAQIPVPYVGCGHKSICLIDFPEGIPKNIIDLPEVDDWSGIDIDKRVGLCSEATWNFLLES